MRKAWSTTHCVCACQFKVSQNGGNHADPRNSSDPSRASTCAVPFRECTSILEVLPRADESRSSASPHSNTMDCPGRVMSAEERGAHGEYLDAAENSLPPTRVRSTAAAAA